MVKRRYTRAVFSVLLLLMLFAAYATPYASRAADTQYHLEKQWVKIWVNTDGTIDLQYTIRIVCDSGKITYVFFDQPVEDFTLGDAFDTEGHQLRFEDATEGSNYKVRVYLDQPITDGQSAEFTATTNVGHMIWQDQMNPGNVGLQFIPTHWDVSISDLRVLVVLPAGVAKDQIRVTPDWDNAFNDPNEDDRLVVYWERQNVSPGTTFQIGVSFPTSSVEHFETSVTTTTAEDGFVALAFGFAIVIVVLLAFLGIVIGVAKAFRRAYADPKMLMETLGIRRGLTAVEASYLLELPPAKIIVMILYSLLQKRAAWVNSTEPSLRLQISNGLREGAARPPDRALRYYEEDFLKAVKPNGTLDEKQLAQTFMRVRTAVENSLRGYCRADTIAFYRKTAQQAWEQVEKAATADVASKLYDENLLWLMMDANFRGKTETAFREIDFHPLPFWWWYWYGYTQYHPNPTYHPTADSGGPTPTIPGAEFANNIATSLEKTAGNFVTNLEKFANSILPAPPRTQDMSRKPVHDKASCVCACVSCACVCACVSCACACASGGGVG